MNAGEIGSYVEGKELVLDLDGTPYNRGLVKDWSPFHEGRCVDLTTEQGNFTFPVSSAHFNADGNLQLPTGDGNFAVVRSA